MIIKIILCSTLIIIFSTCTIQSSKNTKLESKIDYSNKSVLDSLIKITPSSTDTVFLGFRMGMTKNSYENHIHKLQSEGKKITFSNSNRFTSAFGEFNLGEGYTFKTGISAKLSDKTIVGQGSYFLEPVYNTSGKLVRLNILQVEKWNGDYGYKNPDWLKTRIEENSDEFSDEALKQTLIDNEYISSYNFLRQKGDLIIYKNTVFSYIDLKTLLIELLTKEIQKDIIEEESNDIQF